MIGIRHGTRPDKVVAIHSRAAMALLVASPGLRDIMVSTYFVFVLGGVIGYLAGLAVWLLGVPVFVGWQWIRWRAEWGPRARAKTR